MRSVSKKPIRVLVLCHDVIGGKMAGPGIRYSNVHATLADLFSSTLAVFSDGSEKSNVNGLVGVPKQGEAFKAVFDEHDVIFAQWLSSEMLDYAHSTGKTVIIDLYAPVPIEYLASLEFSSSRPTPGQDTIFAGIIETYSKYLSTASFFVCSNERQKDFWIGYITANGFLRPSNFGKSNLINRFAIAPMGISSQAPKVKKLMLREKLGLAKDDFVLLWTGGIWDWFDAQVVIRAVAKVNDPKVKLVFLGTKHPNDIYKEEMSESTAARGLSQELGLVGEKVFFMDGWVPYEERAAYFMDADVAIYADKESLETRFSHRTRVLDHIWTELPTICSRGDYMADLIDKYGFGLTIENRTPNDFAAAISKLFKDKRLLAEIGDNLKSNKHLFTWENTLKPLTQYIATVTPAEAPYNQVPHQANRNAEKPKLRSRVRKAAKIIIKGY
jgi:glycosyltransferase involved in cell wall biosynthesis